MPAATGSGGKRANSGRKLGGHNEAPPTPEEKKLFGEIATEASEYIAKCRTVLSEAYVKSALKDPSVLKHLFDRVFPGERASPNPAPTLRITFNNFQADNTKPVEITVEPEIENAEVMPARTNILGKPD